VRRRSTLLVLLVLTLANAFIWYAEPPKKSPLNALLYGCLIVITSYVVARFVLHKREPI